MRGLCYTQVEAFKDLEQYHTSNIEQLDSIRRIIAGGGSNQPLKLIHENIQHCNALVVSWHWVETATESSISNNWAVQVLVPHVY